MVALAVGMVVVALACSDDDEASGPTATTSPFAPSTVAPPSSTVGTSTTPTSTTLAPLAETDLEELAAALGVTKLVVMDTDGSGVVTWSEGEAGRVDVPADTFAWSDGGFVYWLTRERQASGPDAITSFAATFDGTSVCRAPGEIERVTPRDDEIISLDDGQFEAVIEFEAVVDDAPDEWPRPRARFDCSTWAELPLDPVTWTREAGWRSLLTVAGRSFEEVGDAEGNADITNQAGVSINGGDYAGTHRFSPDGSSVAYGDYGTGASPHFTRVMRVRDTVTGELRWSAELDRAFNFLAHTGDRVLVGQPRPEHEFEGWKSMESIVVLDATTGEEIAAIPTSAVFLHAGPSPSK